MLHLRNFFLLTCLVVTLSPVFGQQTDTISGIVNNYYPVTGVDICRKSFFIDSVQGLTVGDSVLIMQMKGALVNLTNNASFGEIIAYREAGKYQINIIDSVVGNRVVFKKAFFVNYNAGRALQVITFPIFNNVVISDTLTAPPWDGEKGGVLFFRARNSVIFQSDINLNYCGFRGAEKYITTYSCPGVNATFPAFFYSFNQDRAARKGESIATFNSPFECGKGAWANGGGGGNDHNSGGGGGSNYGPGGLGGRRISLTTFGCVGNHPGIGGKPLDHYPAGQRIFAGGGGGAGHDNNDRGSSGGNGGGIVIIQADEIVGNNHFIYTNGDSALWAGGDGAGGGGAGGSVLLEANAFTGQLNISARGGKGGVMHNDLVSNQCNGPGGGGGGGSVMFSLPTAPANVIVDVSGGEKGYTWNYNAPPACYQSPNGATDGLPGGIVTGVTVPFNIATSGNNADAGPDTWICPGDSVQLFASGGFIYSWNPTSGLSCSNCPEPWVSPTVTTTYEVTVSDSFCTGKDTVTVHVYTNQNLTVFPANPVICRNTSITLYAGGGLPPGNIIWSGGDLTVPVMSDTLLISPQQSTTYTVTWSANNCQLVNQIPVVVTDTPTLSFSPAMPVICPGDTIRVTVQGATGGVYSWTGPGLVNPVQTPFLDISTDTTATWSVFWAGPGNCHASASLTVLVDESQQITILSTDRNICEGQPIAMMAIEPNFGNFFWTNNYNQDTLTGPSIEVFPSQTSVWTAHWQGQNCRGEDSVTVSVLTRPYSGLPTEVLLCPGEDTLLSANPLYNYSWNPSFGLSCSNCSNPVAAPNQSVTYQISYSDEVCFAMDTLRITLGNRPEISIEEDMLIIKYGESIQIPGPLDSLLYSWIPINGLSDPAIGNPIASPTFSTTYFLTATFGDGNFCPATDSIRIEVITQPALVPTAFTPNQDGKNDFISVYNTVGLQFVEFLIFNRFGEMVFRAENWESKWFGDFRGKPAEVGVYVFRVKGIDPDGIVIERNGTINLIR